MPPEKRTYHVEPGQQGAWQVRLGDGAQPLASFATQKEAVGWLRGQVEKTRGVEFLLHRRDGWTRALSGPSKGRPPPVAAAVPRPAAKPVVYATDDEAERAAEKVFRLHAPLLAELAK